MAEVGKLFSKVYLNQGAPTKDSERFRLRLASYYWDHLDKHHAADLQSYYAKEGGIKVPYSYTSYSISDMFKENPIRDVLDAITLTFHVLNGKGWKPQADQWRAFVGRALREENVGYSLDKACGVHYFVDEEMERNRASALAVLGDPKLQGVAKALEESFGYLDRDPVDTKAAVRSAFEATEILVRTMVGGKNLNKKLVEDDLTKHCLAKLKGDETAKRVVAKLLESFGDWVDGVHFYRHGQAAPEPVAPSEQTAIHVLSTACSYIRWLTGFRE